MYRLLLMLVWLTSGITLFAQSSTSVAEFNRVVQEEFDATGQEAAAFLVRYMPAADQKSLSADLLLSNFRLAMQAKREFPWAVELSDEQFYNDVLPCLLYTSPSPRDQRGSRMPSSA